MLRAVILRKLNSVENELGQSMDYLRHVVRTSVGAFLKFVKIMPLAQYRRTLPIEPYHIAHIVATRNADCGPCTQIAIDQAGKSGVPLEVLRAVVEETPDKLPTELADVYAFTESVVKGTSDHDRLRDAMRRRYGESGLIELSFAMAIAPVFAVTKRALGYATSCSAFDLHVK